MDEGHGTREGVDTTVFFSYSRADRRVALPIIRLLEEAGFAVWWDGVLEAGTRYVETTEEALETARAVVVLWTKQSVGSNWVRDEAMSGRERGCLVPVSTDGSLPPLGFRQFQVLDFARWKGDPGAPAAQELVRATAVLHGRPASAGHRDRHALLARPTRRRLIYAGIGGAVAIAGGLGIAGLVRRGLGGGRSNSIAVMPFNNDSRNESVDFLSDGLSSELRSMLARNPALHVVARSTSETLKKRGLDAVSIARELGVRYVVEGSVRVVGDIVRVSSDLIEGDTGIERWSRTFDQSRNDLIRLQDTLANTISSQLSMEVTATQKKLRLGQATNPAAFDAYLRGWSLYRKASDGPDFVEVLSHFDEAARLDPGFAGAQASRAATLGALGNIADSVEGAGRYYNEAEAAARRAIELGPDLDEAHSVLAMILFDARLQVQKAKPAYERSIELGAGSAVIQARYAEYAALTRADDKALKAIGTAIELDPLNATILRSAALVHYAARRFDETIAMHRRALELDPGFAPSHAWIGNALVQQGRAGEAQKSCAKAPGDLLGTPCLAIAARRNGDIQAAQAAMAGLIGKFGDAALYQQAQVRAQWNEADAAMVLLAKARQVGDAGLTYLATDPMLDPLRERPDFIRLQEDLGFT